MTGNIKNDRLLNYEQSLSIFHAAGLIDLGVKWIKNQCDTGKLKAVIVNRHRRFKESDINLLVSGMFADVC